MCLQSLIFAKPIVENAAAPADHHLGGARRISAAARRPGKGDARRKIVFAVRVGLRFVTQAIAKGKVRPHPPVILPVKSEISLRMHWATELPGSQKAICWAVKPCC